MACSVVLIVVITGTSSQGEINMGFVFGCLFGALVMYVFLTEKF